MHPFTAKSLSKKILFIAPYPKGKAPSQRFRFEQYIPALEANGFETELIPFLSEKDWAPLYENASVLRKAWSMIRSFWKRFFLLFRLKQYDHIFIHREASMIGPPVFEWFIAKVLRRKYIYDFDDAIWLPNYSQTNARFHRLKAYGKVRKIVKWADQITVGNAYLKGYAEQYNENVSIIPTTVDLDRVHKGKTDQNKTPITIGWTGSHTTMEYLPMLLPILKELRKEFEFKFRVISNHPPDLDFDDLEYIQWNRDTEIEDLKSIQIGVMPLENSQWAKGKCGFKGLQYMSLHIPSVMSKVGVNPEIISHRENGWLCETEEDWKEALQTLIENRELREKLGSAGYQTVKTRYSVEANTTNYLNLFK